MNVSTQQEQTHGHREQAREQSGQERVGPFERVARKHASPYVEQVASGHLLCDAGNPKPVLCETEVGPGRTRIWGRALKP